jgi:uncharacterized membrane protein YozB (DUF420 family)
MAYDTAASPRRTGLSRRFYLTMSLLLTGIVFVGFAPSFYLAPYFERPPVPFFAIVHGVIFSAWMLMFVAQSWLIASRNVTLHRSLGIAGAALAGLMLIAAYFASIYSVQRGFTPFPDLLPPIAFSIVSLSAVPVFGGLVGAALLVRKRDTASHKRLMLLATIAITEAAIARWPIPVMRTGPNAAAIAVELIVFGVILYDTLANRRLHPAMLWGGIVIVASHVLRPVVGQSAAWESFVKFLIGA